MRTRKGSKHHKVYKRNGKAYKDKELIDRQLKGEE